MKEYRYEIEGKKYRVRIKEIYGDRAVVEVNDRLYQVDIAEAEVPDQAAPMQRLDLDAAAPAQAAAPARTAPGAVTAPMPGVILKVLVDVGDMVNAGDKVMVIEAMKMENDIKAPRSGTIKKILVDVGESVNTGDELFIVG